MSYFRAISALAALYSSTAAVAATGCNSMWAQEYVQQHGLASCQVQTVACDSDEDGADDDLCTVNELLNEYHADPLFGERIDSDGDGVSDEFAGNIVPPNGDGNLNTVPVPRCVDGSASCPGEELRCVDGTRPVYLVDPADDPTSNNWLITFQGGGSCDRSASRTGGEDCWHKYETRGRPDMSTTLINGTSVLGIKRSRKGHGILYDDAANEFNNFHRIKVHKCSFDRSTGTITRTHLAGPNRSPDPDTVDGKPANASGEKFNLPFHGWFIVKAVLDDLRTSKTITVYADGSRVALPDLEAAEVVLVGGHSGGSVGLTYKIDRMADHIAGWGSTAEVLGLFDARGKPGLDHEESLSSGVAGDNMYDFTSGAVSCDSVTEDCLPANGPHPETDFSDAAYRPPSKIGFVSQYWKVAPDKSCMLAHLGFDQWRCYDPTHVLYNHIAAPFFMRHAQRDGNKDAPDFALVGTYRYALNAFRRRVIGQALSMREERDKPWVDRDWEERLFGWAQTTNRGLGFFYPNVINHEGMYNNAQFFGVALEDALGVECVSYHDALYDWVSGSGEEFWVEDVDGVTAVAGVGCP